jgi:hypothetical protein
MQVLEGDEDLAGVEFDFVLFEARVGHAFEKFVQLRAGAVSEERSLSKERSVKAVEGDYGLHDIKEELFGFESSEAAHDVRVPHQDEDLALGAAASLFVALLHVSLQQCI